ncbi:MAG: hypothetical protein R3213_11310 [Flavobacteriaceae bacterium]|nr:hypothetical protein [Flavobacteriaceae bacterium]
MHIFSNHFWERNKIHSSGILAVFALSLLSGNAQEITLKCYLPNEIRESSGLVIVDGKLLTHQDSGNPSDLIEIDPETEQVKRIVSLNSIPNKDWEEITTDGDFIYVGDFGNNLGNRKDLTIYKVPKKEYLEEGRESFSVESINFSFADQTSFKSSNFSTAFDIEAFVSIGERLLLFTKDWTNFVTHVYEVPKIEGTYSLDKITTINVNGLVAGATYNPDTQSIVLVGYGEDGAFVSLISDFMESNFQDYKLQRYDLKVPQGASSQIEGIAYLSENKYLLTSETGVFGDGALYELELPQF